MVWIKQAASDGQIHWTSVTASCVVALLFFYTIGTMAQMYNRLHTWTPADANLALAAEKANGSKAASGVLVDEFYVDEAAAPGLHRKKRPDESSALLSGFPCADVRKPV